MLLKELIAEIWGFRCTCLLRCWILRLSHHGGHDSGVWEVAEEEHWKQQQEVVGAGSETDWYINFQEAWTPGHVTLNYRFLQRASYIYGWKSTTCLSYKCLNYMIHCPHCDLQSHIANIITICSHNFMILWHLQSHPNDYDSLKWHFSDYDSLES